MFPNLTVSIHLHDLYNFIHKIKRLETNLVLTTQKLAHREEDCSCFIRNTSISLTTPMWFDKQYQVLPSSNICKNWEVALKEEWWIDGWSINNEVSQGSTEWGTKSVYILLLWVLVGYGDWR